MAQLLWEKNQPDENGRKRHTILIHRPEDVIRLQRSILMKLVLHLNGGGGPEASLKKFIPGRIIEVPDVDPVRTHPVDAAVAKYFFHSTEHFYATTLQEIEEAIEKLNENTQR